MEIKSSAFSEGDLIPAKYTCDNLDISPPLEWEKVPAGTKTLSLICDDPDAPGGTYVHWVIFNIPAAVDGFPEDLPKTDHLENGALQGMNDFGHHGYGGPCPPGGTHRYYFKLYALDNAPDTAHINSKKELLNAMKGHIVAEAQLMGRYQRSYILGPRPRF